MFHTRVTAICPDHCYNRFWLFRDKTALTKGRKSMSSPRPDSGYVWSLVLYRSRYITVLLHRAESRFAPSQWETSLQSNAVSHRLGANLESVMLTNSMKLGKHKSRMCVSMTTSRRGNTFPVTGSLRGYSTQDVTCDMHFKVLKTSCLTCVQWWLFDIIWSVLLTPKTTLSKSINDPLPHDDVMARESFSLY